LPDSRRGNGTEEHSCDCAVIRNTNRATSSNDELVSKGILVIDWREDRDAMPFSNQEVGQVPDMDLNSAR